jgi:hypothetical protein
MSVMPPKAEVAIGCGLSVLYREWTSRWQAAGGALDPKRGANARDVDALERVGRDQRPKTYLTTPIKNSIETEGTVKLAR